MMKMRLRNETIYVDQSGRIVYETKNDMVVPRLHDIVSFGDETIENTYSVETIEHVFVDEKHTVVVNLLELS